MRFRWLLCLSVIAGCAGSASGKPLHAFPSKQALAQLSAARPSQRPLADDLAAVEEWTLELPKLDPASPVHELLARAAPNAKPSAELDCVAHELARWVARAKEKSPPLGLRRFISARCGAQVSVPAYQRWIASGVSAASDEAIVKHAIEQLHAPIATDAGQAGAAILREGDGAIVVVALGAPQTALQPFERVVGLGGSLELRGRVAFDADAVQAYVNQGDHAVQRCERDPAVAPPEFKLSCKLAPGDEYAWVQVLATPRGRVLSKHVLELLALGTSDAAKIYRVPAVSGEAPVEAGASFEKAALETVNRVRAQNGLAELALAPQESATASRAAPALFAALLSDDPQAAELVDGISLGLMAGWDVRGGTIRDGELTTGMILDSVDVKRWVAEAIEYPAGRVVLLDPDARVLALGATLQHEPDLLAAVAITYAFFQPESSPGERAMQVLERLGQVRRARHLGRTALVEDAPDMQEQLGRIQHGEATPEDALRELMRSMSSATGQRVEGFVWETQNLDAIEFPHALLRRADLAFGVGVTYYRAQGGAWGQYAVLFVVVELAPKGLKV